MSTRSWLDDKFKAVAEVAGKSRGLAAAAGAWALAMTACAVAFGITGAGAAAGVSVVMVVIALIVRHVSTGAEWESLLSYDGFADQVPPSRFGAHDAVPAVAGAEVPHFIERAAQADLAAGLREKGFVILTGPGIGGRSHLAHYFLTQGEAQMRRVLIPKRNHDSTDPALPKLLSWLKPLREEAGGYVLLIRDLPGALRHGLRADDIAAWRERNENAWIIATIRREQRDELEALGEEMRVELRHLQQAAKFVRVDNNFVGNELRAARQHYHWLDEDELVKLPTAMCAADERVELYARARDSSDHAAWAITRAAGDWKRIGLAIAAPLSYLRSAFRFYGRQLEDSDFDAGLATALQRVKGLPGYLCESNGGYRVHDTVLATIVAHDDDIPTGVWQLIYAELLRGPEEEAWDRAAALIVFGRAAAQQGIDALATDALNLVTVLGDDQQKQLAADILLAGPGELTDERVRALIEGAPGDSVGQRMGGGEMTIDPRERWDGPLPGVTAKAASRVFGLFYRHALARSVARMVVLVSLDLVAVYIGLSAAHGIYGDYETHTAQELRHIAGFGVALVIFVFWIFGGLYRQDARRARLTQILLSMTAVVMVTMVGIGWRQIELPSLWRIPVAGLIAAFVCYLLRLGYDKISYSWVRWIGLQARTVLVGPGVDVSENFAGVGDLNRPTHIVGYVADGPGTDVPVDWLGPPEALPEIIAAEDVGRVIFVDPTMTAEERQSLADWCHAFGAEVEFIPSLAEIQSGVGSLVVGQSIVLARIDPPWLGLRAVIAKRVFDVIGAVVGIVLWAVPILIAAVVLAVRLRSWPFERSPRSKGGRETIRLYRLKTRSRTRSDAFGDWLHEHGVDEVPQLIGVLLGDMSLVGPRPLYMVDHVHLRGPEHRRYTVRPGVTGAWRVTSRARVSLREMAKLDLAYLRDWSIPLDIEILVKTLRAMLRGYEH